jgi:hypothetical protein
MLQRQLSHLNGRKLDHRQVQAEPESHITTDGQSASLSWNKAPVWGLRPHFYYCQTVAGLLMWDALSDGRTGLSFTNCSWPSPAQYFRVRVPWDSWPYFTLPDWRLPFRRLIRLAGLRWTYSTPPAHGSKFKLQTHSRYIASGRTPWKTRPLPSNGCPILVKPAWAEWCLPRVA